MPSRRRILSLAATLALLSAAPAAASPTLDVDVQLPAGDGPARVSVAGDAGDRARAHLAAAINRGQRCASRPTHKAMLVSSMVRDGRFRRTMRLPAGDRARAALRAGHASVCAWQLAAKHRSSEVLATGAAQLQSGPSRRGWVLLLIIGAVALLARGVLKLLPTVLALVVAHRLYGWLRRGRTGRPSTPQTPTGGGTAAGNVADLAARSARGQNAERAVHERLRALVGEGWTLYEGFFPDGARGDVDHYLCGPGARWVIETKSYTRIRQADLEQAARAADAVAALEQRPVHAVLCLAAGLPTHLEGRRQALGRDVFVVTVETIAGKLRDWDAGCAPRPTNSVEHEATVTTTTPAEPGSAPPAAGPVPFAVETTLDFESLQMGDYRLN